MRHIIASLIVVTGLVWDVSHTFAYEGDLAKHSVHQQRTATVEKVESGLVFFGQPNGVGQRTVSVRKAERMGLLNPKKGDEVILVIDEHDILIDLHPKGVPPTGHRLITGRLTYADPAWEVIEISNADGRHLLAMIRMRTARCSLRGVMNSWWQS